MNGVSTVILSFSGGILPPLIWLWFWLKEDSKHPEPKRLISLAFLSGMLAIAPVIYLETWVYGNTDAGNLRYIIWAAIEEILKFLSVYIFVLRRKEVDEPIDYAIYLITAALGFAALENMLFLWMPVSQGLLVPSLITGNLRFVGSTLLHVAASAIIGIAMGFGFYKQRKYKISYLTAGILLSITLHSFFNLSIINTDNSNSLFATTSVWVVVIMLLLVLERIKRVRPSGK